MVSEVALLSEPKCSASRPLGGPCHRIVAVKKQSADPRSAGYNAAAWLAHHLSSFNVDEVSLAARRIMLERLHEPADAGPHFAFETTLASRTFAPWMTHLINEGYAFLLVYPRHRDAMYNNAVASGPRLIAAGRRSGVGRVADATTWARLEQEYARAS